MVAIVCLSAMSDDEVAAISDEQLLRLRDGVHRPFSADSRQCGGCTRYFQVMRPWPCPSFERCEAEVIQRGVVSG